MMTEIKNKSIKNNTKLNDKEINQLKWLKHFWNLESKFMDLKLSDLVNTEDVKNFG